MSGLKTVEKSNVTITELVDTSFAKLEFVTHFNNPDTEIAGLDFDNGYGVSVVTGVLALGTSDKAHEGSAPYEIAVTKNGKLCYDTGITNDVIGYCTEDEVTEIMKKVLCLNPDNKEKH